MVLVAGQVTTATMEGGVVKQHQCARCREMFVHFVHRGGVGSGTSLYWLDNEGAAIRANHEAHQNLQRELAQAIEAVRCPNCGYFQTEMISHARKTRAWWTGAAGTFASLGLLVLFMVIAGPGDRLAAGATGFFIGAVLTGLFVAAWWFAFDPNHGKDFIWRLDPEVARSGITLADYQKMLEEQAQIEAARALDEQQQQEEERKRRAEREVEYQAEMARRREEAEKRREDERRNITERARNNPPS